MCICTKIMDDDAVPIPHNTKCIATDHYIKVYPDELSFDVGDVLIILEPSEVRYWYLAENSNHERGIVPITFLQIMNSATSPKPTTPSSPAIEPLLKPPVPLKSKAFLPIIPSLPPQVPAKYHVGGTHQAGAQELLHSETSIDSRPAMPLPCNNDHNLASNITPSLPPRPFTCETSSPFPLFNPAIKGSLDLSPDQDVVSVSLLSAPSKVPVTPSKVPVTPTKVPVTPSKVPVTPSKVPATPSKVPGVPSKVPATPSKVPATPSKVPATPSKVPATPSKVPATPSKVPATPSKVPATPSKVPATPSKVPATPSKVPATPSKVPATPSKVPVTPSKVPVTPSKVPVTPSKVPATPSKVSITTTALVLTPPSKQYSTVVDFREQSGWFRPSVEKVLTDKLQLSLQAFTGFTQGAYFFQHKWEHNLKYVGWSCDVHSELIQLFQTLYDKDEENLNPLEAALRLRQPDANTWSIRAWRIENAEELSVETAKLMIKYRTLHPCGLNKEVRLLTMRQWETFCLWYTQQRNK